MSSLRTKALLPRIRCLHHGKPTGCRELRWYLRLRSDPIRVDDGPKRNAKSIEVKNVRYVSDKDLVNDVNLHCKLTRAGVSRVNRSPYTKEERLKMLQDYLADATHPFIRVADYAELTSLPRSTATKELRTFFEDPSNGIAASGRRAAIVYQYFFLLYSLGVHPNCFLKLVEKWERVLKPVI